MVTQRFTQRKRASSACNRKQQVYCFCIASITHFLKILIRTNPDLWLIFRWPLSATFTHRYRSYNKMRILEPRKYVLLKYKKKFKNL